MRVAQLVDSLHIGGAEKLQVTFTQAARTHGLEVTVIRLREGDHSSIPDTLRGLGARVETFSGKGLLDPRRIWALAQFFRRERFDLVQTHLTYSNIIGTLAGRLASVPVVATLHSAALDPIHPSAVQQVEAAVLRFGPQRIIAVGYTVAEFHQQRLGGRKITVIPNAVPDGTPLSPTERTALREALFGDSARPLIISVGRLAPLKGYADLLQAFARVRERHPEAVLAIVGGGDIRDELATQIDTLELAGHAFLLGSRDDVPRLLGASDIYASASHIEGMPLSIMEAMAAGLPVVATRVGDVPHIVMGETGITVPPQQPAQLADALSALLDNPEQRRGMGAVGQRHLAQHYSLDAWMKQLMALFRSVSSSN